MAEENKCAEMIDDIVHGDVWLEMNEEAEARIAETLERARKTRGDKFRVEDGASTTGWVRRTSASIISHPPTIRASRPIHAIATSSNSAKKTAGSS